MRDLHNPQKRAGTLNLAAALAPRFSNAYVALLARQQVADGANGLGNRPPRTIGSSASPLLARLSGDHHNVKVSPREWRMVWLWIEAAAPYAGSYAAVRNTEEQRYYGHAGNKIFGECRDVFKRRCVECHKNTEEQNISGFPLNWGLRRDKEKKTASHRNPAHRPADDRALRLRRAGRLHAAYVFQPVARTAGEIGGGWGVAREVFKDMTIRRKYWPRSRSKKLYDARPPWVPTAANPQYAREKFRHLLTSTERHADLSPPTCLALALPVQ